METTILGIDHGNGNIKTASSVFPCGFKKQETKPSQIFSQDILEYKGCFYSLTPNRFPYEIDKTKNENCLILTLFAIAKEVKARAMKNKLDFDWKKDFSGFVGKDVVLSIGLPPAHFEKQRDSFKNYFLNAARYGLDFRYNDKSFSIHIKEIFVFPQDYAAAIIYKQDLIKKYGTVYCIDIGDGTVDLLALKNGMPDKDVMVSRELGMSRLREQIIDDIINDYNMTLDGSIIEDVLTPGREVIAPDEVVSRIRQETTAWAEKIVDQLHSKVPDFRFAPTILCGGGSILLAPFAKRKSDIVGELILLWIAEHGTNVPVQWLDRRKGELGGALPYFPKEKRVSSVSENIKQEVSAPKEAMQEKAPEATHDVSMIKAGLASFM